jgi:hypothetical protein
MAARTVVGLLTLGLAFCALAQAEDGAKAGGAKAPEQKQDTITKHGVLAEKPLNAAEGVVAILTVTSDAKLREKDENRERKRQIATAGASDKYDLVATGDLATKLLTLARRGATVYVTGTVTGAAMKVTSVSEKGEDGPVEARERREKPDKQDKRDKRERLNRNDKTRDNKDLL